jgi:hypothetical protein
VLKDSRQRNLEGQLEQERQKLEAFVIVSHRLKAKSKCIINPLGLTEVFNPPAAACVDVVFVHGISGHPKDTWTCAEEDVFWPAELLPPVLEDEDTRVLTYGYEAGAEVFTDGESEHQIHEVIRSLGRDLASNRQVCDMIDSRTWYSVDYGTLTSARCERHLRGLSCGWRIVWGGSS